MAMEGGAWLGLAVLAVALWVAISVVLKRRRRKHLIDKYGSELIADKIMDRQVWQGMTSEQLVDSWGRPEDVDEKVYKTKTKQTWKYGKTGKNRFKQRVYVEDSYVVGWQNQ